MTPDKLGTTSGTTYGNDLKREVVPVPSPEGGEGSGNGEPLYGQPDFGNDLGNDRREPPPTEGHRAGRTRVLVADCPWKFGDKLPGPKRGADKHYPTMSVAELCAFPLPPLEPDCFLFFWRVAAMQREALEVVSAWGFTVKTELVWLKLSPSGTKRHFGMGRVLRAEHEVCLVATRGRPVVKRKDIRSTFEAVAERVHSRKPDDFYRLVELLCAGPYTELFARRRRAGWACFGNELPEESTTT